MTRKLNLINWFGGKGQMLAKLLPLIPSHKVYVEVFGGGASLLLNKKPSPVDVYNDIDGDLVNLFRVIRDKEKFERFQMLASLTLYAREEFEASKLDVEGEDDVERAYRFFVRMKMSFSGLGNSWSHTLNVSRRGMSLNVSRWLSVVDSLEDIHVRMRTVQIERLPFLECIEKYDSGDTFFYLDPPYVHSTRVSGEYNHEMSDEEHEQLVEKLLNIKGKAMLSGYDNEIYKILDDSGWQRQEFEVICRVSNHRKVKAGNRTEVVWMNYEPGGGVSSVGIGEI